MVILPGKEDRVSREAELVQVYRRSLDRIYVMGRNRQTSKTRGRTAFGLYDATKIARDILYN